MVLKEFVERPLIMSAVRRRTDLPARFSPHTTWPFVRPSISAFFVPSAERRRLAGPTVEILDDAQLR